MKTWTPDASEYFESWLGRMRLSVAGDPRVDANDVAEDLRAHVHAELAASEEPVTVCALERVLDSLGNPAQWDNGSAAGAPQPKRSRGDWVQRNVLDGLSEFQARLGGDLGMPVVLLVLTVLGLPRSTTASAWCCWRWPSSSRVPMSSMHRSASPAERSGRMTCRSRSAPGS